MERLNEDSGFRRQGDPALKRLDSFMIHASLTLFLPLAIVPST